MEIGVGRIFHLRERSLLPFILIVGETVADQIEVVDILHDRRIMGTPVSSLPQLLDQADPLAGTPGIAQVTRHEKIGRFGVERTAEILVIHRPEIIQP